MGEPRGLPSSPDQSLVWGLGPVAEAAGEATAVAADVVAAGRIVQLTPDREETSHLAGPGPW